MKQLEWRSARWLGLALIFGMMRSSDGITWQALPLTSFVQSHPLFNVVFGYADPSAKCPLP